MQASASASRSPSRSPAAPGSITLGLQLTINGVSLNALLNSSSGGGLVALRPLLLSLRLILTSLLPAALQSAGTGPVPSGSSFAPGVMLLFAQDARNASALAMALPGDPVNLGLFRLRQLHGSAVDGEAAMPVTGLAAAGAGAALRAAPRHLQAAGGAGGVLLSLAVTVPPVMGGLSLPAATAALQMAMATQAALIAITSGAVGVASAVGIPVPAPGSGAPSGISVAVSGVSPSPANTPAQLPATPTPAPPADDSSGLGAAVGAAVGSVLAIGILLGVAFVVLSRRRAQRSAAPITGPHGKAKPKGSIFVQLSPAVMATESGRLSPVPSPALAALQRHGSSRGVNNPLTAALGAQSQAQAQAQQLPQQAAPAAAARPSIVAATNAIGSGSSDGGAFAPRPVAPRASRIASMGMGLTAAAQAAASQSPGGASV